MSKSTTVKLKKNNIQFEILCKPETVTPYRNGKLGLDKVILVEEIFSNASKLTKVKETDLKKGFGTDNKMDCIKVILEEGQYPYTKNELAVITDAKRKEIVNYIVKYYHDPKSLQTSDKCLPHPASRIESVLDEMKVVINPNASTEQQIKEITKKLPNFLPVKPIDPPHLMKFDEAKEAKAKAEPKQTKNKGKDKHNQLKDY